MKISDATLQEILVKNKKTSQDVIDELVAEGKAQKKSLQEVALKRQIVTEKELVKLYATTIDIPYIELGNRKIEKEVLQLIPDKIAQKYKVVVFEKATDGTVKLAMDDPDDIQAIDFLQKRLGKNLQIYIAPRSEIELALNDYRGSLTSEISKVSTGGDEEEVAEEEVNEEDLAEDSPIAQTVNLIIEYAIKQKASDIHIEPHEDHVQIRYRIDGILKEANKLPRKVLAALVSRIKILSNLKIDEHRAPQDGRFKISLSGELFAIRVSTLPVMDGEKVVMRLLSETSSALTLEDLGFWGGALERIQHAIAQPHGIILVTGPTGSGKSTTLYSVLSLLNSPDVNISTIEDPVEYRIEGTNQTQVNPKANMTFAAGLRALLRQDPNIIMVGEIRDSETANLAIQAALTGHLVFSTLHTNNAATALPRLLDMGIEPFLIASTVRAIVGQRLVRKLSAKCRDPYKPDQGELTEIKENFDVEHGLDIAADAVDLQRLISPEKNSDAKQEVHAVAKNISELTLWRPKEDGECAGQGYKGRIGIYEVLGVSSSIQKMITANATSEDIQTQAVKEGMLTMQQDGFVKCLHGLTSIEEILRVTRE